jgi:pilus assembly protein CpaF
MSILRRIEKVQEATEAQRAGVPARTQAPVAKKSAPTREDYLRDVKLLLQDRVIGVSSLLNGVTDSSEIRSRVASVVDQVTDSQRFALTRDEKARITGELVAEIDGFGPIEPLLRDESITEVMVNGPHQVYIERRGRLELSGVTFWNDEHVLRIIDRIIAPIGRRIDESSPRVDARLPDGSRVNAIIAPLSLVGPVITIRKFAKRPYTVDDLIGFGTATEEMFDFLRACVEARLNLFVSGGTGSGKTTTLNVISQFIPENERIVTIEDAAELQLRQEHVVTLESRPPNLEGQGEMTIRDLLHNALHMRPDRIIVGECRGGEALDMIQAMTVGHEGSLSTGHANTPPDMLRRLETMVLMSGYDMPLRSIREQITSAVDLIVHTARLKDGSRKIVNITEVYGIDDDVIQTQDIFVFEQTGVVDGKIQGALKPTGKRPTFMYKFQERGIELPPGEFGIPPEDPAKPGPPGKGRARYRVTGSAPIVDPSLPMFGYGRPVHAGGMAYLSSIGPVDPATGQVVGYTTKDQARQCLRNIKARLEADGSSLEQIVWANWSLRDPAEFDSFYEEWMRWFPGEMPVGQGTIMPPIQRRTGFRVSIGVIAQVGEPLQIAAPKRAAKAGKGATARR